ncbi:MAG: RNA polymerase factor sigma-54 [Hydrogenibacillus schlegelii]|nr:RNA polymerase factor sigma-54 [Hydrogenibacillus schlegelii]
MSEPTVRLEPSLKTELRITAELKQSLDLLMLGLPELTSYIDELARENPALHVDPPLWQTSGWATGRPRRKSRRASNESDPHDPLSALRAPEPSLTDRLKAELRMRRLDSRLLRDACLIVEALDERGFLGVPLEALAERFARPLARLEAALVIVQSLDPPGIGARNLRECLHLQHRRLGEPLPVLSALIDEHLEDVAEGRLEAIARRLRVPIEAVVEAVALLKTFNPRPGGEFAAEATVYVIPEAAVQNDAGTLTVILYDDVLPRLSIDPAFARMERRLDLDPRTRDYVSRKIAHARKLIDQVRARKATLARVLEAVVRRQQEAFLHGPERLKPLTMQVIAEDVGLSVSTISRTVREKHIETPWGVIEFKRLFPSPVGGSGDEATPTTSDAIIRKIKAYIEAEDKTNPLSDEALAALFHQEGVPVSRRTVAKYRAMAGIPSSHQRRRPGNGRSVTATP